MRALDAGQILAAWDRGIGSLVDDDPDLPVGGRDALLLALHRGTFSDTMDAVACCPSCGTDVELAASCAELLAHADTAASVQPIAIDGYQVSWRLPTAADLAAVADRADPDTAAFALLERCVTGAEAGGRPVAPAELPVDVRAALSDAMAAADPLVDVMFELTCPECGSAWQAGLDPAAFLWAKVSARAERMLREVDALARAYGWSEPEVLALSPARRAAYLRMVGDG